jgi:hypothetical protein
MSKHLESALAKIQHATKKRATRDYREAVLTEDECSAIQAALRLSTSSSAASSFSMLESNCSPTWNSAINAAARRLKSKLSAEQSIVISLDVAREAIIRAIDDMNPLEAHSFTPEELRYLIACVDRDPRVLDSVASIRRKLEVLVAADPSPRPSPLGSSIPSGWTIQQTTEGLLVCAPDCDPGAATMTGPGGPLVNRLLYRLASDLVAAAPSYAPS